ncbi:MAG TPA: ribose-phosphate pyrophosphokinase [Dehalococcoidia bacterium]|nr:ribose-phosphate pyrophosphokinase [Dehalococcoidia bacterium]
MGPAAYQDLRIFSGNAHPALTSAICNYLECEPGKIEVFEFSNENIFVQICENVRQRDTFLVQPIVSPVNTRLVELLIMIDTFRRASAGRITAVIPYYAYGRSDKKDQPRVPITARLIANLIETAGADRVLTVDLHAGQIQGFFNIPVDELTALYEISKYVRTRQIDDLVVVATDVGDSKRARNLAQALDAPLAIIEKRRVGNIERAEALNVIGDVQGRRALIVDDEIDTGGTIVESVGILKEKGARECYAACTHAIFSHPAAERLASTPLEEIVITDTVPVPESKRAKLPNIQVLSLAPLLGEAIRRIHTGQSIGELFG